MQPCSAVQHQNAACALGHAPQGRLEKHTNCLSEVIIGLSSAENKTCLSVGYKALCALRVHGSQVLITNPCEAGAVGNAAGRLPWPAAARASAGIVGFCRAGFITCRALQAVP